jgi:hypothetical protein
VSELHHDRLRDGARADPPRRGLRSVVVTTLQAVSGTGKPGIDELERQLGESAQGKPLTTSTYPRRSRTTCCRCARRSATTATRPRR